MGKPGWEDKMVFYESQSCGLCGQLAKSRGLTRRAVEAADREGQKEAAAAYQAEAAVREALAGNSAEAKHGLRVRSNRRMARTLPRWQRLRWRGAARRRRQVGWPMIWRNGSLKIRSCSSTTCR